MSKNEEKEYIKIIDAKLAATLVEGGFSYIKENINSNQEVYVFEKNGEILKLINRVNEGENFGEKCYVIDCKLIF